MMLYFIPTPIGNKEDITLRALRLMRELPILICEDTRTTKKLLAMYEIPSQDKQFFSLTSFTDKRRIAQYLQLMQEQDVGMLSDAGTPGLSDPGKLLIQLCNEHALPYTILPGANALIPAVVGAAFPTSEFHYLGFLPQKKGRQTALKTALSQPFPTFFYESVHRMEKLISDLDQLGFQGKISIARELTKLFEEQRTYDFEELKTQRKEHKLTLKGEFVIGLSPQC